MRDACHPDRRDGPGAPAGPTLRGVNRRVSARSLTTTGAVAGEFARRGSGYVLASIITGVLAGRRRMGRVRVQDGVAVALVVAAQPFFEWALHRYVLHGPPRRVHGRTVDAGVPHRGHHEVPDDVGGALLGPSFAASDSVGVAALVTGVGLLTTPLVGRVPWRGIVTGVAAGVGGLARYEWAHLLHHSGRRPRTARGRRLRAHHMAHHHRDEGAWFGVTGDLADRVFGTAPHRARLDGFQPLRRVSTLAVTRPTAASRAPSP